MAITIRREKNDRGVPLKNLKLGATFLYDNRVGVIVERNGHTFPIDLTTCTNFRKKLPDRPWIAQDYGSEIPPSTLVLPVEIELSYKVVG